MARVNAPDGSARKRIPEAPSLSRVLPHAFMLLRFVLAVSFLWRGGRGKGDVGRGSG